MAGWMEPQLLLLPVLLLGCFGGASLCACLADVSLLATTCLRPWQCAARPCAAAITWSTAALSFALALLGGAQMACHKRMVKGRPSTQAWGRRRC